MQLVVADSSFYLCFLEDIEQPQYLLSILDHFAFVMPPIVQEEVRKCGNYKRIHNNVHITFMGADFKSQEILRPLFSAEQWRKGEAEVITLAYHLHSLESLLNLILDDIQARTFVERNLNILRTFMIGTLGFIVICYQSKVFSREDSLHALTCIENSNFRAGAEVLSIIRTKIVGDHIGQP